MTDEKMIPQPRVVVAEPQLHLTRHRLSFEVADGLQMPRNQGSLWRSALGRELRAISEKPDAFRLISCGISCQNLYRYFFETPAPDHILKLRGYSSVPHPFVIAAPCTQAPVTITEGGGVSFDITLIGRASQALPIVATAFECAGQNGLGERAIRARLLKIEYVPVAPILPSCPERVRFVLETPLQLRKTKTPVEGSTRPRRFVVGPPDFQPHHLFGPLVRRISMLMTFHMDFDLDETHFSDLKAAGRRVHLMDARLDFSETSRGSLSQSQEISLNGLTGEFVLDLGRASTLWPYLWLGQWVHAGKHTTEGLGAYRVLPL
jgi:hypothetical protein